MPPYFDVYVLSPDRSAKDAERFLDAFVPQREPSTSEYEFPQYAEQPQLVIRSAREAIHHCEAYPDKAHSLYFRNLGAGPAHAMLFFTSDGALIFGLSVVERADEWFARLKELTGSKIGYVTFEEPPVATASEFRALAMSVA